MHDVTAQNRPWLLDYALHHPDVPDHWPAHNWSSAGEQRIKALGCQASNLTSREALRTFISIERLRGSCQPRRTALSTFGRSQPNRGDDPIRVGRESAAQVAVARRCRRDAIPRRHLDAT